MIDVSTILAGPLCCQILGDFGADVIKVEHPVEGDGMRGHGYQRDGVPLWWKEISRNKRTVGLDLHHPRGWEIFLRLVETADVVVENFRPGTLERWGGSPEQLHEINPRLIIARISGFGQEGPYAHRQAFGTLAEAMSGFAFLTGSADGPPTLPAFGLADSVCGVAAASAVTMALYHRDVGDGSGQVIDLSILEPIMAVTPPVATIYDQLGIIEERKGNRTGCNAPRNIYRTKDDQWVAVSASAQRVAERVMGLVGRPQFVEEEWFGSGRGRAEHVEEIDEAVASWIRERTREEVLAAFDQVGAAAAPVYDARDLVEDRQVHALDMITTVEDDELGPMRMRNVMWRMSSTPGSIRWTGRALGADTEEILTKELDITPTDLDALRHQGVVA